MLRAYLVGKLFGVKFEMTEDIKSRGAYSNGTIYLKKEAEAIKVTADAEAYAVKVKAEADAEQTRVIASAIKDNGQPAINYEVMKRQVEALSEIASSNSSKTVIMPTEITGVIGSLQVLFENIKK